MPAIFDTFRKLSPRDRTAICLALTALLIHYTVLLIYAENIPIGDDYYDVFRFLYRYEHAASVKEKLLALYAQHNEHRTTLSRIVYLAMYDLSGTINFRELILIGDLSTLGIIILLAKQYKNQKHAIAICAFIATFILNLQSWQSMLWAMTALSSYSVIFFMLACFTSLTTNKTAWVFFAMLFAVCASLSMGNGLLAWPLGLLCIFLSKPSNRNLHVALWLLASAVFIFIYLYGYTTSPAMQAPSQLQFTNLLNAAKWVLVFLGSSWAFESLNITTAMTAGVLLVTAASFLSIRLIRTGPAVVCFMAFIIGSAAITAYSRSIAGPEAALHSRYKIYSIYLSCLVLVHLFTWLTKRASTSRICYPVLIAIAVLHTTATYATSSGPMRAEQRDIEDSMRRWLLTGQLIRFEVVFIPDGGTWIEDSIISKRWDSRPLFTDSLYFGRKKHGSICSENHDDGELRVTARRHPEAVAGEIVIDDGLLIFDRPQYIVACRDQRAYIAAITNPSRNQQGHLVLHYLKTDPIEHADTLMIESRDGKLYKAMLLFQ